MMKPLGIILYDGPSLLDGKPIVCIATGIDDTTENEKTGDMIQTWIIKRDMNPLLAIKTAAKKKLKGLQISNAFSVCGDCKHIHFKSCYVNLAHGPNQVFDAFHRNRYEPLDDTNIESFKDRYVRIGAYGDPAAVPIDVWHNVCMTAKGWTGYTHQWTTCNPELSNYVMASCDTEKEYYKAITMGWRTFRVRQSGELKLPGEFVCPASEESGKTTDCENCGSCSGSMVGKGLNPTIIAHGGYSYMSREIAFSKGLKKMA